VSWQDEFKNAVAQYVIERGMVTNPPSSEFDWGNYYGGPYDFDATYHLRGDTRRGEGGCEVSQWSDIQEEQWRQFSGTFDDGDGQRYGISVKFSCKCGRLKDRRLLTEDRFGEVLRALVGIETRT